MAQGFQQLGHEGVDLVVGAGGVFRELKYADIGGLYVEGDRAYLVIYVEHDVAGLALGVGHVVAHESGEVAAHHLHKVAVLEVDVVEGEVWKTVFVCPGDVLEVGHPAVVDHGVAFLAAVVDEEGEAVGLAAEALDFLEGAFDEYVMESEVGGAEFRLALALFLNYIGGGEDLEVRFVGGVEAFDGLVGAVAEGLGDVVQDIPKALGLHFLELGGLPVFIFGARNFLASPEIF